MALKSTLDDVNSRLTALLTYANGVTGESDTSIGDAIETLADGYGGSSLPIQLEAIGTWTGSLAEYTDSSNWEYIDTGINVKNSQHIYIITTIECDGTYTDSSITNYWSGITVALGGKYTNFNYFSLGGVGYRSSVRPFTNSEIQASVTNMNSYGVCVISNYATIKLGRKCHATGMPKIMGGNYTVNVYGISAI